MGFADHIFEHVKVKTVLLKSKSVNIGVETV
jgi:hypothetical protein